MTKAIIELRNDSRCPYERAVSSPRMYTTQARPRADAGALVLWVPPAAVTTPDEALPPGGPGTMAVWNSPGSSSPGSRVSYPLYGEVIAGYWCCYRLPNLPNRNRGGQRLAVLRNACGTPHKTSSLVVSVTLGTFCPRADRPSTPRDSEEDQKLIKH